MHISHLFLKHNDKVLTKTRLIQEKKLIGLGMKTASETNEPEKVIFNFSSVVLTPSQKSLLAKGLNLSIPPKKLNYADALAPFELLYRDIEKQEFAAESKEPFKASLKKTAFDMLNNYNPKLEQNLPPDEVEALKSLLAEDAIVIQKSDKGNSVVILDKEAYVEKVLEIISDTTKFKKLKVKQGKDYNYIINQEKRITEALYDITKGGVLDNDTYEQNKTYGLCTQRVVRTF